MKILKKVMAVLVFLIAATCILWVVDRHFPVPLPFPAHYVPEALSMIFFGAAAALMTVKRRKVLLTQTAVCVTAVALLAVVPLSVGSPVPIGLVLYPIVFCFLVLAGYAATRRLVSK